VRAATSTVGAVGKSDDGALISSDTNAIEKDRLRLFRRDAFVHPPVRRGPILGSRHHAHAHRAPRGLCGASVT
jgi:hypothetical protein